MKPLYTSEEFEKADSATKLACQCYNCNNTFYKKKKYIQHAIKNKLPNACKFCNHKCHNIYKFNLGHTNIQCIHCKKFFLKANSEIRKYKNHFCSQSCSATFSNSNKSHGTRRSKLENYLEEQLTKLYPDLLIDFNEKDTINSELDIYIPSLKLAFELNGIFHYEPIFGSEKLDQIQNNDQRKFQACAENNISLCIIDTSGQKYFKESTATKFLSIIIDIVNNKSKNLSNS